MDDATISELRNKVYAVLFSSGRAVDCEELVSLAKAPEPAIREAIRELRKKLEEEQSPLFLTEEKNGNAWKLTVRDRYVDVVRGVTPHTELEIPVLATLALIAWKQPMLQSEVIKRRSTVAYEHIAKLEELGFISKEKKGRSFLLKPTGKFFDYFDLPSQEAVRKLFEQIEPRVQKMQQMSDELVTYEAKGLPADAKKEKIRQAEEEMEHEKLGLLDVYGPEGEKEAGETEKAPQKQAAESETGEGKEEEAAETEQEAEEENDEEAEKKEKKVLDELFEDEKKKKDEQEEKETRQESKEDNEEEKEKDGKEKEESEEQSREKREGEERREADSEADVDDEQPPLTPKKQEPEQKRKLPKELEEFAGKEERIGE